MYVTLSGFLVTPWKGVCLQVTEEGCRQVGPSAHLRLWANALSSSSSQNCNHERWKFNHTLPFENIPKIQYVTEMSILPGEKVKFSSYLNSSFSGVLHPD